MKVARLRVQRVAEQLKKEIAEMIRTEVKDPRIGFATVTRVDLANDLQHAKVYVSVFGSPEERQDSLAALQRASGYLRGEVGRRLRLRLTPELVFKLDESGEYSDRINKVIKELHSDDPHPHL